MKRIIEVFVFCIFVCFTLGNPITKDLHPVEGQPDEAQPADGTKHHNIDGMCYACDNRLPCPQSADKERREGGSSERKKRASGAYMTDHGYGSRLLAGQNMAKDISIIGDVYGKYGPGKRTPSDMEDNLVKRRHTTDHGYGSRVEAGDRVANTIWAKDSVYGEYGPGKKRWWRGNFVKSEERPKRRFVPDGGYGTMTETGEDVANQLTESDEEDGLSEIVVVMGKTDI